MSLISAIFSLFYSRRLKEIDRFEQYPAEIQQNTFCNLVRTASNTEWGKNYEFPSVKSVKDFRERLPLQTYDDLLPYVERLGNGELDLLWPGKIKWFARSSGTTSTKSKFIPMSHEALFDTQYRAVKDILAIYFRNNPSSRIFHGKALTLEEATV
jgi:hypothetical protein